MRRLSNNDDMLREVVKTFKTGTLDEVKHVIRAGFDPRFNRDFVLLLAAWRGELPLMNYLISAHGLDVNCWQGGPLQFAASEGHLSAVEFLIKAGADPSANRSLALHWAVRRGRHAIVKFLLRTGMSAETLDEHDLLLACGVGELALIKLLIEEHGLKVDQNLVNFCRQEKRHEIADYLATHLTDKG